MDTQKVMKIGPIELAAEQEIRKAITTAYIELSLKNVNENKPYE